MNCPLHYSVVWSKNTKDVNSHCRGGLTLYDLLICPYFLIFLHSSAAYSYLDNFLSGSDLCKQQFLSLPSLYCLHQSAKSAEVHCNSGSHLLLGQLKAGAELSCLSPALRIILLNRVWRDRLISKMFARDGGGRNFKSQTKAPACCEQQRGLVLLPSPCSSRVKPGNTFCFITESWKGLELEGTSKTI